MPPLNIGDPAALAVFLDFDGTLVTIADRPENVHLAPTTLAAIARLYALMDGALAIVTGRDIAAIDDFFAPLVLPVAGVHGAVRRRADGAVLAPPDDGRLGSAVAARAAELLSHHPGLVLEHKHGSVALHYRARPDLEAECLQVMQAAVSAVDDAVLKRGKMVLEAKAIAGDKGTAIADFLAEPPFAGRRPVFAGDDVTDEDGFAAVNSMGGVTIKVGPGTSAAQWRAQDTEAFLAWLGALPEVLSGRGQSASL